MSSKRTANVTTAFLVVISLIICSGSVFWFFLINTKEQTKDFVNTTQISVESGSNIIPNYIEEPNMTFALKELRHMDCNIIKLNSPLYLDNPHYLPYNEFRTIAFENKYVILSPNESLYLMVILIDNVQFIWVPN